VGRFASSMGGARLRIVGQRAHEGACVARSSERPTLEARAARIGRVNLEQLKKNVGWRVQLEPPAIHLDGHGRELPLRNEDWIIQGVIDSDVRLDEATVMGLTTRIGKDSIHHCSYNAARSLLGGIQYGFLTLGLQMTLQNDVITFRPCRPGERVAPPAAPIAEKCADFQYLVASGLQKRLEDARYEVGWCADARLSTLVDVEGWEVVMERDRNRVLQSFRIKGRDTDLVFVKRKRAR